MKPFPIVLALIMAMAAGVAAAEKPLVVSSIKPVQLLVAAVAGERVDNRVLLAPNTSPHHFQLRPSDVRLLHEADAVFWIGPALERFLEKSLRNAEQSVVLWPEGPDAPVTGDHDHAVDPHVWLSVAEVRRMTRRIAEVLARRLPADADYFRDSAERFLGGLDKLDGRLAERLAPLQRTSYLVFHDGYRRFERQYGIERAAAVRPSAEQLPGARHLAVLRQRVISGEFECVFVEPQYDMSLLDSLLRGARLKTIEVDPMGVTVPVDRGGFLRFYSNLGEAFAACEGA